MREKDLTPDELEVQTDRVLEYYGLNVSTNKLSLNCLTKCILDHEQYFKQKLEVIAKQIEKFNKPEGLKWVEDIAWTKHSLFTLSHKSKSTFVYCEMKLPSIFSKNEGITIRFYKTPSRILLFNNNAYSKTYKCELEPSAENRLLEINKIKQFCIDHLKSVGFNLPEIK